MSTKRTLIALPLVFAVACGGGQKEQNTSPQPDEEPAQPPTRDFVFDGFDEMSLEGKFYRPEALPDPPMLRVVPKRKPPLQRARRAYKRTKGARKEQKLQILATLLWDTAKKIAEDKPEKAEQLKTEARDSLREHVEAADEPQETTLLMLGGHEIYAGDTEKAIAVYEQVVERFSDSAKAQSHAARLAYLYLLANRLDDAAGVVEGWELGDELGPDAAYVLGWVRFYQREFDQAREALVHAAANWGKLKWLGSTKAVDSDVLLATAFAVTPVEDATAAIESISKNAQNPTSKTYYLLYQLNMAYQQVGQFEEAAAALDAAAEKNPDQPPSDEVAFPSMQTDYYLRADQPVRVADTILAAWEAVQACGEPCANTKAQQEKTILQNIEKLALHFHTVYATSLDESYFDPAMRLYQFYLEDSSRSNHGQVQTYKNQLEETEQGAQPNSGKHTEEMMRTIIDFRKQAFVRCYESVLQTNPSLTGTVTITIEVDATGEVTGGETEPPGGQDGLAAVARCMNDEAGTWSFPGRNKGGKTVVVVPFAFGPAAGAPAGGAQQPAEDQTPAEGGGAAEEGDEGEAAEEKTEGR